MILTIFLSVSTATWPVFFTARVSADYSWHLVTRSHTQVKRCVELVTTTHVTRSVLETTTSTHYTTVHYSTCWYQCRETVSPTLSVKYTFKYNIFLLTIYTSSESLSCVYIFVYLFMYITPNKITYRHHVNWPTHKTKTAKKKASPSANNAQQFGRDCASKKGILCNNSNMHQKNESYLLEISLRNTIRKPSHRAQGQFIK